MMNALDLAAVLPATLTAANTSVGLSGEIISHSHIGQEFAWPPNPRQARQTQREYMASHAKRVVDAQGLTQFYEPAGGQG
ncbi:MAG: hypothetical protein U1E47_09795 [Rivihabitans pingtungensis]